MENRNDGGEYFMERVCSLLYAQRIPARREMLEECTRMMGYFLRLDGKITRETDSPEIFRLIAKNPRVRKTIVSRKRVIEKREIWVMCRSDRVRNNCVIDSGINPDVGKGPLVCGSLFYNVVIALAAGCWNVLGEIIVELAKVGVRDRCEEDNLERESTRSFMAQLTHWIITEAVFGGTGEDVVSRYLSVSLWRPRKAAGECEGGCFVSSERLLALCCSQGEYLSVMPRVAEFLLCKMPSWHFCLDSLHAACERIHDRVQQIRLRKEGPTSRKIRMCTAVLEPIATHLFIAMF